MLKGIFGGTDEHPAQDIAISNKMEKAISLWARVYKNDAPWLKGSVKSLGLPAAVASELARQVTIEFKSDITGESARAKYLNEQYQPLLGSLRAYTEYGCAKGGLIFKPYPDRYGGIAVDVVQADGFAPTSFDSRGGITGAVFTERLTKGKQIYTRYEYHSMADNVYTICNIAYQSDNENFNGHKISLTLVPEWADLLPEATLEGISKPLFGYFRVPFANTIDPSSPLGVSVYSRAVDLFRQADEQWERILWEYKGGELAIDVSEDIFEHRRDGSVILPTGQERLFRAHDIDVSQTTGKFLEPFSPELRDTSLFNGLNGILKRIEFNCGLAYGTLSDPQEIEKTAQEIKSGKQRSYSTVADIQKALQKALEDTVCAMDVWCTINSLATADSYQMSFDWDDSILVDTDTQRMQDKEDVRDGLMQKYEYRMKWYGENEAKAKQMVGTTRSDNVLMGFGGDG